MHSSNIVSKCKCEYKDVGKGLGEGISISEA